MPNNKQRRKSTHFVIRALDGREGERAYANDKSDWGKFLDTAFAEELAASPKRWNRTISNLAFRMVGLELKSGLLEATRLGPKAAYLAPAFETNLILEFNYGVYSVLEGVGSILAKDVRKEDRKYSIDGKQDYLKQWMAGVGILTGMDNETVHQRIGKGIIGVRDRIHQDDPTKRTDTDFSRCDYQGGYLPAKEMLLLVINGLSDRCSGKVPESILISMP